MSDSPESLGKAFDALVTNIRRIGIAHVTLGAVAALAYWVRPGAFVPHRPFARDIQPIISTTLAWLPHLIGYLSARKWVVDGGTISTLVYIITAITVSAISSCAYSNLLGAWAPRDPVTISFLTTLTFFLMSIVLGAITALRRSGGAYIGMPWQ